MFGLTRRERDSEVLKSIVLMDIERLRKALARGGSPNLSQHGEVEDCPLFLAAKAYDGAVCAVMTQMLVEANANLHIKLKNNETIMHILAQRGNLDAAKILAQAGSDLHAVDANGDTPLVWALRHSSWEFAEYLLQDAKCPVASNKSKETPLVTALRRKDVPVRIIRLLLERGVDKNMATRQEQETALHFSAVQGNVTVLALLLEKPGTVDVNAMNSALRTPLWLAIKNHNHDCVDALILHGANIHTADRDGIKPLYLAAEGGSIRMLRTLFKAVKMKNTAFLQGDLDKSLLYAADRGFDRMAELLIAEGADVQARDSNGRTPLMKAVINGNVDFLNMLVRAGAATDAVDNHGLAAYDHAVSKKNDKARDFLARYKSAVQKPADNNAESAALSRFMKLGDHSIETREPGGLTMVFNFWTQQVLYRDTDSQRIFDIRNFADVQRQESIEEAWQSLVALKGNPPELKDGPIRKGSNPLAPK